MSGRRGLDLTLSSGLSGGGILHVGLILTPSSFTLARSLDASQNNKALGWMDGESLLLCPGPSPGKPARASEQATGPSDEIKTESPVKGTMYCLYRARVTHKRNDKDLRRQRGTSGSGTGLCCVQMRGDWLVGACSRRKTGARDSLMGLSRVNEEEKKKKDGPRPCCSGLAVAASERGRRWCSCGRRGWENGRVVGGGGVQSPAIGS